MPPPFPSWLTMPPLPQAVLAMTTVFIMVHILLFIFRVREPRIRSLFYTLSFIAPLVILLQFADTPFFGFKAFKIIPQFIAGDTPLFLVEGVFIPNFGGIIIAVGLILGALTLLTSYLVGETIIRGVQGVIDITGDDEPTLHGLVIQVSKKMGMNPPRIGIVDDLRPNAFTVGGVKGPLVVFSSGLLATLNKLELEAVTAHELGHIKNRDFGLLVAISALKTAFFYNPLSFLAASLIAREREYMADIAGSKTFQRTNMLQKALIKIASAPQIPNASLLSNVTMRLFVYEKIGTGNGLFSTHPALDTRLARIESKRANVNIEVLKAVAVASILLGSLLFFGGYITHPEAVIREVMFKLNLVNDQPFKEMIKQSVFPPDGSLLVHRPPPFIRGSFEIAKLGKYSFFDACNIL
jgi:heat shock protein HtpX